MTLEWELPSSYYFKSLVETAKRLGCKEIPVVFSCLGMTTAFCSQTKIVVFNAMIRREDSLVYRWNITAEDVMSFNVNVSSLSTAIKSFTKKDRIALRMSPSIGIEVIGVNTPVVTSAIRGGVLHVPSITVRPEAPLATAVGTELAAKIIAAKDKADRVRDRLFGKEDSPPGTPGVIIRTDEKGSISGVFPYIENYHEDEFYTLPVNLSNDIILTANDVAAVAKAVAMTHEAVVRIYASEEDHAFLLHCKVGPYGSVDIIILKAASVAHLCEEYDEEKTAASDRRRQVNG